MNLPATHKTHFVQEFSEYDKQGALLRQARTALDFDENEVDVEEGGFVMHKDVSYVRSTCVAISARSCL